MKGKRQPFALFALCVYTLGDWKKRNAYASLSSKAANDTAAIRTKYLASLSAGAPPPPFQTV